MSTKYSFGRMSDASVLALMDDLIRAFKTASGSVSIGDITSFAVSKSADNGIDNSAIDEFSSLFSGDTYLITVMDWQAGSTSNRVIFRRQKVWALHPSQTMAWLDSPNPYIDSIEVDASTNNAPYIMAILNRHINMAPPVVGGPEAGTAMDQSQAILNRVSSAVSTLIEHTAERQKDLDQTRVDIAKDAEKIIEQNKNKFEEEIKLIEDRFFEKERALLERENALDDRANTHVRREFAKNMADLSDTHLKSNLLTKSRISFWIPLALCVVPIAILSYVVSNELGFISIFGDSIGKIAADTRLNAEQKSILIGNLNYQILYAQIRIILQSLGIAALVWFALRLASSRYSLVSGWERDLHRFRLDTERAGFLVEGDLEARKVNQEGLPDVLLESFSRNLFSSSDNAHGPTSSEGLGGALNALLGQAAKVRVGPDGVNVEVEGKGIRKARKLIEDE